MLLVKLYDGDKEVFIDMHDKPRSHKPILIRWIEYLIKRIKK